MCINMNIIIVRVFTLSFIFMLPFFSNATGHNGVTPDATYNMSLKYNPITKTFYDFIGEPSLLSYELGSDGVVLFRHVRDNLIGMSYDRREIYHRQDSHLRAKTVLLSNGKDTITVETAIKRSEFPNNQASDWGGDIGSSSCANIAGSYQSKPWYIQDRDTFGPGCRSTISSARLRTAGTLGPEDVGYIERAFRFNLELLSSYPNGVYTGTLPPKTIDYIRYNQGAVQRQIYNITLEIINTVTELKLPSGVVGFDVSKSERGYYGVAFSEFEVMGSFNREQKFNLSVVSHNSQNGKLSLYNSDADKYLDYDVYIFDAYSSSNRLINMNGGEVALQAPFKDSLPGVIEFRFDSDGFEHAGDYRDVIVFTVSLDLNG